VVRNTEMPLATIFLQDRCHHGARVSFSLKLNALCLPLHLCVRPSTQVDCLIDPCPVGLNACWVCGFFVAQTKAPQTV